MVFGRRKKAKEEEQTSGDGGNGSDKSNVEFPWNGSDFAPCNFAFGHLRDNLAGAITHDGRVHAETYVATIGGIAGFTAQNAAFEKMKQNGIPLSPPYLNTIGTKNGKTYFFGDAQNHEICNHWEGENPGCGLWPLAAGGAIACGLAQENLPSLEAMFAHVSSQIGAEQIQLRVGDQAQPMAPPDQLLKHVWPLATMCFGGKFPGSDHEFGVASVKYRPIIASFMANQIIQEVKDVLPPEIALTIVMESAIFCSKLDPREIMPED